MGTRPAHGSTTYARLLRRGDRFYVGGLSRITGRPFTLVVTGQPILTSRDVVVPVRFQGEVWFRRDDRVRLVPPTE